MPIPGYYNLADRGQQLNTQLSDTSVKWDVTNSQALQLDMLVTRMGWGGLSSRPQAAFLTRWEYAKAASRHFPRTWTLQRFKVLAGGLLIAGLCRLAGPSRAARVLDRLRVMRGLPPCWGSGVGYE